MTDDAIAVLKQRLAAGEISITEYQELLALISEKPTNHAQHGNQIARPPIGELIFDSAEMKLYSNAFEHQGQLYLLADVESVRGYQAESSLNFVTMDKSSHITIRMKSGECIELKEDRAWFGGKRHEEIGKLIAILKKLTFQSRAMNLADRLRRHGSIPLTQKIEIGGKLRGEIFVLHKNGTVTNDKASVRIKVAKASGTFGVGTNWTSINGMNSKSNPNEVVLSESRGFLGRIPGDALRFTPFAEDVDVVHAVLSWMADPNNELR